MMTSGIVSMETLGSQAFADEPYEFYAKWLAAGPVHRIAGCDVWLVLDYDGVSAVAKQSTKFSSRPNADFSPALHGADGADHASVRKLLQPLFAPELQLARREAVARIVKHHVDRVRAARRFDAVADLARPLTHALSCDWLGLNPARAEELSGRNPRDADWKVVSKAIIDGGLLSALSDAEASRKMIAELAVFLLAAGVETVREFLLSSLLVMSKHSQPAVAHEDLPPLVDELLRLEPPVHTIQRRAVEDVPLGGCIIPKGSLVWASIASANRDPAEFEFPGELRPGRSGARHLSFGAGHHFCLGSHLGRLECEMIISEMLPDFSDVLKQRTNPEIAFSGPGGAPSLRQVRSWSMSLPARVCS